MHHNRHVYHSIKELHLWNLPCLPNCLDDRYLALHHHWNIDDRETLLVNDLDHTGYFFQDLWFRDVDHLLPGVRTNALLWEQSHNINDLVHDSRKGLIRYL